MWTGNLKTSKGCKVWKFLTSNGMSACTPSAKYTKDGVFSFVYRKNYQEPDRKALSEGIRSVLGFQGKYLTVVDHSNHASTIEFYCKLPSLPTEEVMDNLEKFLCTFC